MEQLPPEWKEARLKYLVRSVSGSTPSKDNLSYWDGDFAWASPRDMGTRVIRDTHHRITSLALDEQGIQTISTGALLIVARSGILKHKIPVALNEIPVTLNQDLWAFLPQHSCVPSYLRFLIEGHQPQLLTLWRKQGATVESLDHEAVMNTIVPIPPIWEQRTIASFLDHETARIDRLIKKQQRLIELLQEKRQAVISHTVTKGLNPDAPMKDSGIQWLGNIPAHWTIVRLKHLSPHIGVGVVVNPSSYVTDNGLPFLFGGNVKPFGFELSKVRRISAENSRLLSQSLLRSGDLVCVRVGYPGVTAVVPETLEGANCASMMVIRSGKFCSQWLCFVLNSSIGICQVEAVQYGAAQKQFNISDAVNFKFPAPPREEQRKIADTLTARMEKLDQLDVTSQ
ncbi:type I restriction-modification system specificity subunit S [Salinisphaera sp. PC39]|uniref:restriction endonuclease subunit S n=1 Tax=Salinisphaera sp. PC39 TaxID=1304156 RepID=UPI00333E56C9